MSQKMTGRSAATRVCSPTTDWFVVNSAPTTNDNSGSTVVNPAGITRAAVVDQAVDVSGQGTTALLSLKYDAEGTLTDPVVNVFGVDGNGNWQALADADGNYDITLPTAAGDVTDGTYSWTVPVEVDCKGNETIYVAVKTAFAASTSVTYAAVLLRMI